MHTIVRWWALLPFFFFFFSSIDFFFIRSSESTWDFDASGEFKGNTKGTHPGLIGTVMGAFQFELRIRSLVLVFPFIPMSRLKLP